MKIYQYLTRPALFVCLLGFTVFTSCQKEESFNDGVPDISFDSRIPDSAFFGTTLKVDLIAKNVSQVFLFLTPQSKPDSVAFADTLYNENNNFLLSTEVDIPSSGAWNGAYLITLKYGDKEKSRPVFLRKSPVQDYFLVGGSSAAGWEPALGIKFRRFTKDDKEWYDHYGYFTEAGDGLKILPTNTGWDGDMGMKPGEPGKIVATDEQNIAVPADGFYRLRLQMADAENRTYTFVPSKWGVIGDATPGGWDNDTDMTLSSTGKGKYEWTATLNLSAGKEFKFRENDAWDVNLGTGSGSDLVYDGANIKVDANGSYTVKLILGPAGYTYTISKN